MKGLFWPPHNFQITRFCKGQGVPFPCSTCQLPQPTCSWKTSRYKSVGEPDYVQPLLLKLPYVKQKNKPSQIRCLCEQGEASFVCLWVAIDRSQIRLLEIYIAVELPVSAVALTKPLPIVFDRQLFRRVWNL